MHEDEIRERYERERQKRLRDDGLAQYVDLTGQFEDFDIDPWVEPGFTRDAITKDVTVVIVGGGFAGMLAAVELTRRGICDFHIIEKGGDFGGTWYWNRYPGCMCDVESYTYMPLLEETGYMPTEKYASAPEIFEHCQRIGNHFDLYPHALFQTDIDDATWDDKSQRWTVTTSRGDSLTSRFFVTAGGILHKAKLPGIPGIQDYAGRTFHTARWDYDFTGGAPREPMDKLDDKRVGIIGTGATAIQVVPQLGRAAKDVYVFQRTPSAVGVRNNGPTDEAWYRTLEPGWQDERMRNFTQAVTGEKPLQDLVGDGWTEVLWEATNQTTTSPEHRAELEQSDMETMAALRKRVDEEIDDPETAEKLKPYYKMFCKRPCFNDDYLPTFNRPNVQLVDTDGKGVDRITSKGLVVGGTECEVDCIIFATGFEVGTEYARRCGYEIVGRSGKTLSEHWKDGMRTMHGILSRDFPNCFIMSQTQGGFTANFPHLLEELSTHLSYLLDHARENGHTVIEPSQASEDAWVAKIIAKSALATGVIGGPDCTPGYYNNEGKENPLANQNAPYGGGSIKFFELLTKWREAGALEGLEFSA